MKKLYIITILGILMLSGVQEIFAQKTLRIRISNLQNTPGTDCDGFVGGGSNWEWQFNTSGGDPCFEEDNSSANNFNPNSTVFGTNTYYSRNCWPTGNFSIGFRAFEDDGLSNCDQECSINYTYTNEPYRAWNSGNGTYTDWNNISRSTSCNCPVTVSYQYDAQQIVGGSAFNADNLDGSDFVNNTTACTARNMGSGTGFGATGNYATQCVETWYYYNLTSNRSDLTFNPSQNSGALFIYYSPTNSCGDLCFRTNSGGGAVTLRGAPAGRYYFRQLASGGGNTNISISSSGTSHDEIQSATNITPNYSATVNNSSYTEQSGEPNPAGDIFNTWWYTFVTPPGGYPFLEASISEGSGNNSAVAIYRYNSDNCSNDFGTNLTVLASDRWCASSGGSVSTNCLAGNTRYYVQYGTADNFALCIGGQNTGSYNISINTGSAGGPDAICAPEDFGTIGNSFDATRFFNNNCLSISGGEPRTGDMSNTMWYKFRTPAGGLESVTIEAEEAGEGANYVAVALYEDGNTTCGYSGLTERAFDRWCASSGGDITFDCLNGNRDFYIQLGTGYNFALCTDLLNGGRSTGRYRMRLRSSAYSTGVDNICSVTSTSFNINSVTGSTSINNESNICAGTQGGEPGGGQNTVWYRFTTGATVPYNFNISMDAETNGLNSDVYVYEACSGCSFGGLTELDNFFNVNPLPGEFDASGTISGKIKPNSTYYIRADGVAAVGTTGGFDLDMSWNGTFSNYDDFCNAYNLGTVGINSSLSLNNFNNYSASAQEQCALNEPNYDNDDETVWLRFTTSANPPSSIDVDLSADGGTGQGGACVLGATVAGRVRIYRADGSPTLPGNCAGWTNTTNWFSGIVEPSGVSTGIDVSTLTLDCPQPSTTYWLQVETGGLSTCDNAQFDIVVDGSTAVSAGDICSQATSLGTLNSGATIGNSGPVYSNLCANGDIDPSGCGFSVDNGVWFTFTTAANTSGFADFRLYNNGGDNIDLQLTVYEGNCGSLTEIACDYDGDLTLGTCVGGLCDEDLDNVCVRPSTTYYVLVDGGGIFAALSQGIFGIEVIDRIEPSNDTPCGATDIGNAPIFNTHTTRNANNQSNLGATNCFEPNPDWFTSSNNHGVWYKTTAPGRTLVIDANMGANDIDIKLAVYQNVGGPDDCNLQLGDAGASADYFDREWTIGNPTLCVGANGGLCGEDFIVTCLDPTKDVYIMVDGANDLLNYDEGDFSLTTHYPREGGRTPCLYNASTNSEGAPRIGAGAIPDGGSVNLLNNSNFCGLTAAELGALGVPQPSWGVDNAVWYVFRPPTSGSVKFTATSDPVIGPSLGFLSGDAIDLQMAVYESSNTSCSPPGWSLVSSASSSIISGGFNEELIANCLDDGKDYYLLVDGSALNSVGFFDLNVVDYGIETTNDLACDAIDLIATATTAQQNAWDNCNANVTITLNNQNNYCAGNINEPTPSNWGGNTDKIVWYKFTAPASGGVWVSIDPTTSNPLRAEYINAKVAIYDLPTGQDPCTYSFQPGDEVASDYDVDFPPASTGEDLFDNILGFNDKFVQCLEPGKEYYILVDGQTNGLAGPEWNQGEFSITIESSPRDAPGPNDAICDAAALGDPTGGSVRTQDLRPRGSNSNDPYFCMDAENNFCMDAVGDPSLNGFGLWGLDQTAWYTFVAPLTGSVRVDATNVDCGDGSDDIDLQIAVVESLDNTCTGTMNVIEQDYDPIFFDETIDVHCLDPGRTYWILIDGGGIFDLVQGCFEVEVTEIPATVTSPVNDDVCGATASNPFPGPWNATNQTNRCASIEPAVPTPSSFGKDRTVWYTFTTPNGAGPYAVNVDVTSALPWPFGDAMDPQIALYESSNNTCSGALSEIDSDYDPVPPFLESFEFHCLEPNTPYWLMVDGSLLNAQGNFSIEIDQITANPVAVNNDICSVVNPATGALGTLGASTGNTLGGIGGGDPLWNNFCADVEAGEPTPDAFGLDQTVWFSFTTPNVGGGDGVNVNIQLENDISYGDQIDLQLAVYQSTAGCSGTLSEIESSSSVLDLFDEDLDLCLRENTEYWIQVDGSGINTQGYFKIEITNTGVANRPTNDDFCNATTITVGSTLTGEDNNCATLEINEPGAGTDQQKTVWYQFVAPTSGRVEIRTQDADGAIGGIDPEWHLYAFDGSCVGSSFSGIFTELESAYFPTIGVTNPDDVSDYECLFPGETYYIQVDGTTVGGPEGTFNISVTDLGNTSPSNEECAGAINLPVNSESCQFSTGPWSTRNYDDATRSLLDVSGCGNNCGDTWYRFTMPATGFAKIEGNDDLGVGGLNNSQQVIIAYNGSCGSLSYLECDIGGGSSDVDFSIGGTPGETIWLQVFSNNGNSDDGENFQICVSERCSADDCLDAVTAGDLTLGDAYCFDVRDATGEDISGSSEPGYTVCGSPNDPEKSVYFKFSTDDFCWGYEVAIQTSDLSENGSCIANTSPTSQLSMAIFNDDDGTFCDNSFDELLDCETFNDCTFPGGVNETITYLVGATGDSIRENSEYIIQLHADDIFPNVTSDDIIDGLITVRKICDGREWAYAPVGTTSSNGYCDDAEGWRHYFNDNGTPTDVTDDILIFSVDLNGNNFDGVATITLLNNFTSAETLTPTRAATYTMRRYWDFDITSGSIDPNFPVGVRFYYEESEKNEIIAAAQTFAVGPGIFEEPFEWFKTVDGTEFSPSLVNPRYIESRGWSETGQFTPNVFADTDDGPGQSAQDFDEDPRNQWCNGVKYVEMQGLTGFSGGTGATGASDDIQSPLPVELVSFVGWNDGDVNELEWITASEINNDVFVVERSTDAINFVEIGTVDGSGTTTEEQAYAFTDVSPIVGVNYYRLKQIDFDGTFEYTSIIAVSVEGADDIRTAIVKLHPNPTNRILNVQLQSASDTEFAMQVIDITGRVVENRTIQAARGLNTPFTLDVEEYPSGVFIISLFDVNTGERLEAKFIKE